MASHLLVPARGSWKYILTLASNASDGIECRARLAVPVGCANNPLRNRACVYTVTSPQNAKFTNGLDRRRPSKRFREAVVSDTFTVVEVVPARRELAVSFPDASIRCIAYHQYFSFSQKMRGGGARCEPALQIPRSNTAPMHWLSPMNRIELAVSAGSVH